MTSQIFDKMVKMVKNTAGIENAHSLLEWHCHKIEKKPEELLPDDAGLIVLKLMSDLSSTIPAEEWDELDNQFKILLDERIPIDAKVKGILLNSILDLLFSKGAENIIDQFHKKIRFQPKFRDESWYPVYILEELLIITEDMQPPQKDINSLRIGEYISTEGFRTNGQFLFGNNNKSFIDEFQNINEIIDFNSFSIKRGAGKYTFSFQGTFNEHFQEFLLGICYGIFKNRNMDTGKIELEEKDNITKIDLRYENADNKVSGIKEKVSDGGVFKK
jgi:hypothetical protein